MAVLVGWLRAPAREREELVAHVDERHPVRAAAQRELEQLAVERERLVDVADLERDVVDPNKPSIWHAGHCSRPSTTRETRVVEAADAQRSVVGGLECRQTRPRSVGALLELLRPVFRIPEQAEQVGDRGA